MIFTTNLSQENFDLDKWGSAIFYRSKINNTIIHFCFIKFRLSFPFPCYKVFIVLVPTYQELVKSC